MVDIVLVYSGGMDSTALLNKLIQDGKEVATISFDYGSKHNFQELTKAKKITDKLQISHRIINLPFINDLFNSTLLQSGDNIPDGMYNEPDMKVTVVPFRNGIMLSIAVGYAESIGAKEVCLASHRGDHFIYPDCRPEFNKSFKEAAWLGSGKKVKVSFPFNHMDKRDIGDLGKELGIDFNTTWTCYKGKELHCGTCGACQERKYALRHDEKLDPTIYEQ